MLSRNEAVSVVLSFYDRLDELKNRNVSLVETVEGLKSAAGEMAGEKEHDDIADAIYDFGRENIVRRVTYTWRDVSCKRVDGELVYSPDNFEDWLKMKVSSSDLPEWLCFNDFKEYCSNILLEMYNKEMCQALDVLKTEEAEESEGE